METIRECNLAKKRRNLRFDVFERKIRLPTMTVKTPFAAMVVGVVRSVAVDLFFPGNHEPALAAADHAGVGEGACFARSSWASEKTLDMLELLGGNDGRMFPRICLAFALKNAGIEGVRKNAIDGAQRRRFPSDSLPPYGTQAPVLRRHFPDAARGVRPGRHQQPHPLD